ncbi:hypothetical protein GCM10010124_31350 [Pilimelia terevasa]|uniref:HTH cro/C1-type domain-containing protein n=2 Tax=Pilimelia terevasa TaxID=53372 RepID=A0A8J3FL10_9ACTN|nr:hypothetical protein GCM10010124_31350 [Pilimelia terevasa]
MGQQPRRLTPSASTLHYFGAELRRLRTAAGLSQAELGRKIRYTADTVRRCETAERVPSDRFVTDCDTVLGAGGALAALWKTARFHGVRRPAAGDSGFEAPALDRPTLDWLLGNLGHAPGRPPMLTPDEAVLDRAAGELERLREADHRYGAGVVHDQIDTLIAGEVTALRSASDGPAATSTGRSLVVGAYELAGYAAVDVGAVGTAQRHYLNGLVAAQDDRRYGAYLIGVSLAHLALHCGDASTALRMSLAASAGTDSCSTPAIRSALAAVTARAHARLGEEAASTRALAVADRELEAIRPGDEPAWIGYFDGAYLADERAHCLVDLGQHRAAQAEVRQAVASLAPTRRRRLAIDTALLATSLAASGDIEEACAVGRTAVDHAAAIASLRSSQRVLAVLARLADHADVAAVREFREYATERLSPPAAAGALRLAG